MFIIVRVLFFHFFSCILYATAKYMDHYSGHHFQDFSPNPAPTSDVYLYNRPQASGNRGIACIAFALVDGRGNPVNQLSWPRPISATHSDNNDSTLDDFQQFIKTSLYEKDFKSKRPGREFCVFVLDLLLLSNVPIYSIYTCIFKSM